MTDKFTMFYDNARSRSNDDAIGDLIAKSIRFRSKVKLFNFSKISEKRN